MALKPRDTASPEPARQRLVRVLVEQQERKPDRNSPVDDADVSRQLAIAIALSMGMPFQELPAPLQQLAKSQWDLISEQPTNEVNRLLFSVSGHFRFKDIVWLPYWQTLPDDQREPRHVLHQILEDQAQYMKLLDPSSLLASLPAPGADDVLAVKQFLVQRLADSDFDERGSHVKLWPEVAKWLIRTEMLSAEDANRMLAIVKATDDQAIEVIGNEIYSKAPPRGFNSYLNKDPFVASDPFGGGGGDPFGVGDADPFGQSGGQSGLPKTKQQQLAKILADGCQSLIKLLKLEADFPIRYRIPGGSGGSKRSSNQGGMF